jgi:P27 family predicted phage terminase small subunit
MSKPKAIRQKPAPKFENLLGKAPPVLRVHALQVWKDTVKELESVGIGTRVEANALSCYCQAVADFHSAQDEIDKLGLVVITERGAVKNPACTIKNQAMLLIHRFASAFGLTPASRDRVSFTGPVEPNPFAEL